MEKQYQKLRKSIFIYIIWMILFWGIKMFLSFFQIEYRLWLSVPGYIISAITPFILLGLRINIQNQRLKEQGKRPHYIFITLYILFSCAIFCISGILGLLTISKERITEDNKLEVRCKFFSSYYYPYEKISFWGRKPAYGLLEKSMLEEKYGCKFTINNSALDIGWIYYIPKTYPDTHVRAYVSDGKLVDNFSENYVGSIFSQVHKEHDMKYEWGIYSNGFIVHSCLITDWSNLSDLASDAAILILGTLEEMDRDINAPCDSGILYIRVEYHKQTHYIPLPFGNSTILEEEGKGRDYYASPEHVYEELMSFSNKIS